MFYNFHSLDTFQQHIYEAKGLLMFRYTLYLERLICTYMWGLLTYQCNAYFMNNNFDEKLKNQHLPYYSNFLFNTFSSVEQRLGKPLLNFRNNIPK